ncbi:hypothetical protein BU23DRAFT_591683 [Bimuria novae-zelandiae CBS 107.79]|uniref:Fe2OG dioxygenase domain-containing protein n=1 Tax=Bimuria novae-zelandiae CBS 107.79 TaxID=1447943 RepID=A0A6A5UX73_9PLEO|nr:hypothetical protein BU23DRAFT_591683 [Bimuria novae-zelandiae CBS 107.79]
MAANTLQDSITEELSKFINSKSATFACGGSVPIVSFPVQISASSTSLSLRWDSPNDTRSVSKLSFPISPAAIEQDVGLLELVRDCQPASFGFKGNDVVDYSYRKAIKMDRSAFSIDFCPYEHGIIDTVAQLLLPNAGGTVATQGVKAELYKLNIYSAPSGFFKPHVDTPRSDKQFGSLVIALPCHHEGGQLIVRHADQSVTFDWGSSASHGRTSSTVQWAAFYSDCEHEVKEVSEGYRITLTYNLYYSQGVGDLSGSSPAMDVTSLLLYHKVKAALEVPNFMAEGGSLGIFCQHAYAHSTPEGIEAFPGVLKGVDMAVYSVFLAIGLHISVRPVLEFSLRDEYDDYYDMDDEDPATDDCAEKNFIGRQLKSLVVSDAGGYEESRKEVLESYGGEWLNVNWLTNAKHKNIGYVHMAYGNEASTSFKYTHAALIVSIPPTADRRNDASVG